MEPSLKAKALEQFLDTLTPRTSFIRSNICTWCRKSATQFRDPLSAKEYTISGFCQTCQDETFGKEDD